MSAHPLRLSVDELMAESREIAGVDIVDEEVVEPLTVLHRALNEEGRSSTPRAPAPSSASSCACSPIACG